MKTDGPTVNYHGSRYTLIDNSEADFRGHSDSDATFYGRVGKGLHDLLSWLRLFKGRENRVPKLCRTSEAKMVAARWERGVPLSTLAKLWASILARAEARARRVSFR